MAAGDDDADTVVGIGCLVVVVAVGVADATAVWSHTDVASWRDC